MAPTTAPVTSPALVVPLARPRAFDTIVLGGAIAGILDITDALVTTLILGGTPIRMLQGIARGLLGPAAFDGGPSVAALGLVLHFVIALGAATTFFVAATKWTTLVRYWLPSGLVFGLCVSAFVRYGAADGRHGAGWVAAWPLLLNQLVIHAVGVGVPIAWLAARSGHAGAPGPAHGRR